MQGGIRSLEDFTQEKTFFPFVYNSKILSLLEFFSHLIFTLFSLLAHLLPDFLVSNIAL